MTFDPDEQVQPVVRLIFRKFEELGTLNAVLRYLVRHQIQVGIRIREGPGKGEVSWHRPSRVLLQNLLKNPIYAGADAYGRRQVAPAASSQDVRAPGGWSPSPGSGSSCSRTGSRRISRGSVISRLILHQEIAAEVHHEISAEVHQAIAAEVHQGRAGNPCDPAS